MQSILICRCAIIRDKEHLCARALAERAGLGKRHPGIMDIHKRSCIGRERRERGGGEIKENEKTAESKKGRRWANVYLYRSAGIAIPDE